MFGGTEYFSQGQSFPITGVRPSITKLGLPTAHGTKYGDQMLHGDQTRGERKCIGSITYPALAKHFATQTLTRDLFAVANILLQ